MSEFNYLASQAHFDLTDGALSVDLIEATDQDPAQPIGTQVVISISSANQYQFNVTKGQIQYREFVDSVPMSASSAYVPVTQHRLRLRHESRTATVYWEAQPEGSSESWITLNSFPAVVPMTNLIVSLGAGTFPPGASDPGRARFDHVLVTAPACVPLP